MRSSSLLALALVTLAATGCKKPEPPTVDAGAMMPVVDAAPPPEVVDASTEAVVDAAAELTPTTATVDAGHKMAGPAIPFVAGETWNGTYNCGATNTMALKITAVAGNHVNAVFAFKSHNRKDGEFTMSGNYEPATKHMVFNAGNWIKQPPGFVTVGLDGTVSEDKHQYAGKVNGPGCSTFLSRR